MPKRPKRYTDDMLQALANQTVAAMALNALIRGVLFVVFIQLLTLFSGLQVSSLAQIVMLVFIFTLAMFSVDIIEKYVAQSRLKKRGT